jgi:hypothetical protein
MLADAHAFVLCSRPMPNAHSRNAQNEREGGHQDRAKARAGGVHSGFARGDTFLFLFARELDDQDGVLGS